MDRQNLRLPELERELFLSLGLLLLTVLVVVFIIVTITSVFSHSPASRYFGSHLD